MNVKRAQEIVKYGQDIQTTPAYAAGYLECYEKMSGLISEAKKVAAHYSFVHSDMSAQTGMRTAGQILIENLDKELRKLEAEA